MSLRSFLCTFDPNPTEGESSPYCPRECFQINVRRPFNVAHDFCDIFVTIPPIEDGTFTLVLQNVPFNRYVEALAWKLRGRWRNTRFGKTLSIPLNTKNAPEIRSLIKTIWGVTAKGSRYPTQHRNWKFIVPLTVEALEEFARRLEDYDRQTSSSLPLCASQSVPEPSHRPMIPAPVHCLGLPKAVREAYRRRGTGGPVTSSHVVEA